MVGYTHPGWHSKPRGPVRNAMCRRWDTPDRRPRLRFGLDVAKRLRSVATAFKMPLVSSLMTWKVQSGCGISPKTLRIGSGERAEPSVVIPFSVKWRASKAVFKRPRNASYRHDSGRDRAPHKYLSKCFFIPLP